jgi:hypothetical protein
MIVLDLKGNIIDAGNTLQGLSYAQLSNPIGNFKKPCQNSAFYLNLTIGKNDFY